MDEARKQWRDRYRRVRAERWDLDLYEAGDVLLCTRDAFPYLKRGLLYRVRDRVQGCHAYHLEGIDLVGFWGNRLRRAPHQFTRSGPIVRVRFSSALALGRFV